LLQLIIIPLTDNAGTISTDSNQKVTIYKAFPKMTLEYTFDRSGKRLVTVEFHAYANTGNSAGDQLFLLGDTAAS